MKFSYNWLKELSGTKKDPEQLADILMMHSFEVESVERIGKDFKGIIVGEILEIKKHPNADKLQLTRADIGNKKLDIVCGAWNIKIGDKVPVATIGAKLASGLEVKEIEIRGEKSEGMLCAEDELGLGADHSGILILDPSAKIGSNFAKYHGTKDTVLEIKVLADRSHDALNHVGIAREIAAIENAKIDYDYDELKFTSKKTKKISVEIKDKKLCPRYVAAVLENIQIKESPLWLKERLKASGMRPINNIVDATNYIMLELGQPLHAFDLSKIPGGKIVVRTAKKGEKITLLDGKVKDLKADNLLITGSEKVLAIAGVMGGIDSGIGEQTKTIVLESANFDAISIRKTRISLGLKTDASDRFEKNIDPNLAEKAMARTIEIIERIASGKAKGIVDVYPKPIRPWKIKLDFDYVNKLLGENIPKNKVIKILKSLGLEARGQKAEVIVPTFRIDLKTREDLIEEIGRIYGYEKIKPVAPVEKVAAAKPNEERMLERRAKDILIGLGFDEVYNYSFYGEKDAQNAILGERKHLELANPMNPEQKYLRTSLIPNVLKNIQTNLKNFDEFSIFESGRVYIPGGKTLPVENKIITLAVVLKNDKNAETFFDLKGRIENFLSKLEIENVSFGKYVPEKVWHPVRSAEIRTTTGKKIGVIGEINPFVLAKLKIKKKAALAEFDLDQLMKISAKVKQYEPLRKYPIVSRDISILVKGEVTVAEAAELIRKTGGKLAISAELFDIFQKDGKNSLAFHINFASDDRTLENREIDELMRKIISALEKDLKGTVRK